MRDRQIRVEFYLNDTEADRLNELARRAGRSKSSWLRSAVMGYQLCEKPDPEFYRAMRELSRFGNNLNQLTAIANALGFLDVSALTEEIQQWHKFRADIYKTYLEPRRIQRNGSL